jgi:hypothetical protein
MVIKPDEQSRNYWTKVSIDTFVQWGFLWASPALRETQDA